MNKVKALLLVLIALLQYRLWFGDGNVRDFQRLNDRIAELRQEGAKRRERNAALEAEVMDLKQGLDAIEERARQDMDMVKEGEVFVQVIDPEHEDEAPPSKAKPVPKPEPKPNKPREAAKPRPVESPPPARPKPAAPAKPEKPPAPKPAPAKAAKPAAQPKAASEPLFDDDPPASRPANLDEPE